MTDLLYQFVGAGYSPGVNFESGRITALKLELNKIFCIIQAQAIDGVVVVDTEEVYNNMNLSMCTLTSKLFLKSHLSYYTAKDLEVFRQNIDTSVSVGELLHIVARIMAPRFGCVTSLPEIIASVDRGRKYQHKLRLRCSFVGLLAITLSTSWSSVHNSAMRS